MISNSWVLSGARLKSAQVFSKLGRCAHCMRTSAAAALAAVALAALLPATGAAAWLQALALTGAVLLSCWLAAHLVAYVLRGPERATGCKTCAEKAKARARAYRWRRLLAAMRGARNAPARRTKACRNCRPTAPEAMVDSPAAAPGLRHVAEGSPEFARIRARLASTEPADSWQADQRHFFLYDLVPQPDGTVSHALFITRWEDDVPISAVLVTPDPAGGPPQSVNLSDPSATI